MAETLNTPDTPQPEETSLEVQKALNEEGWEAKYDAEQALYDQTGKSGVHGN